MIILPYPLSDFDVTGIILVIFTVVVTILYGVSSLLSDQSKYTTAFLFLILESPDAFDRRSLYDAETRIKEQETYIQQLKTQGPSKEQLAQLHALTQKCESQEQTIRKFQQQIIDPHIIQEKDQKLALFQTRISELEITDQDKDKQIKELQDERNLLQQKILDIKNEYQAKEDKLKRKVDALDADLVEAQSKLADFESFFDDQTGTVQVSVFINNFYFLAFAI